MTTPVAVTLPGQSGAVTAVAAGDEFSLVLTSSGQLYTFGSDETAALGRSVGSSGYDATPTVVAMPDGGTTTLIAAGENHGV